MCWQGVCRLHGAVQAYVQEEEVGVPPMEYHGSQPTHAPGTLERILEAKLAAAHTRTGQPCSWLGGALTWHPDAYHESRPLPACALEEAIPEAAEPFWVPWRTLMHCSATALFCLMDRHHVHCRCASGGAELLCQRVPHTTRRSKPHQVPDSGLPFTCSPAA